MRRNLIRRWLRRLPVLTWAGLSLVACDATVADGPSLRPAWLQNQEFHLETQYNLGNVKTDRGIGSDAMAGADVSETVELGERWTDPVVWRYQIIRQGFVPPAGDDFEEFYVKGGTESPLTVIKASLNPSMNLESELLEADPKIYMVVREDRLRLAGLVYFYTANDGQRIKDAVTVDDDQMNRSFSTLSQTNLSVIPHFIPPFPIAAENKDVVLEDGQLVNFTNASETGVDVVYENSIDGSLIAETWEDGMPWATTSITPSIESRLMDPSEIDDLGFDNHDDGEDVEYIDLLKQSINISDALFVNDMVGDNTFEVREQYKPWSGSWWRQSEGALIFGQQGASDNGSSFDSLSDLRRDAFAEHARNMQNLGEEMRNLRRDGNGEGTDYDAKAEEYKTEQQALVDKLVAYYGSVRAAIDGGQIRMANRGTADNPMYVLQADPNWNGATEEADELQGFEFEVDSLSPLDKFALLQQANRNFYGSNPWYGPAWEMLNHWSPAGSGWWGHCNGWAAAAILANEPRESHTVTADYNTVVQGNSDLGLDDNEFGMELTVGDMKGLLSETYYSQLSSFYGSRYNGEDDDISDLSPKAVLHILSTYIGQRGVPLVFDTTAGDQVWNYPAFKYSLNLTETTVGNATDGTTGDQINVNVAGLEELKELWGINTVRATRIIAFREANGPFQDPEDIIAVRGIGRGIFNRNEDRIITQASTTLRTFDGALTVYTRNDGVGYEHLDRDQEGGNNADIISFNWPFTLEASPAGEIISGAWDNNESGHPDFAWIPYTNTARSGRSENGYLYFPDLKDYLPEGMIRE